MPDFAAALEAKQRAKARLLAIPGVHAVGIGHKWTGGRVTSEPSVMVFVEKKKPLSEIARKEVIPAAIDGILTDVHESGVPVPHADTIKHRPLTGGIQIEGDLPLGEGGTLGCFAKDIEGKIFAITNHHVVASVANGKPTALQLNLAAGAATTVTIGGTNTPGSLLVVGFSIQGAADPNPRNVECFYRTNDTDTAATAATSLTQVINSTANPDLTATLNAQVITLTVNNVQFQKVFGLVSGPPQTDPASRIHAKIEQDANVPTDHRISISGRAKRKGFGSFVANAGGQAPTRGLIVKFEKDDEGAHVSDLLLAQLAGGAIPGITATASGNDIVVHHANDIQFDLHSDQRAGQPRADFPSICGVCCDKSIGTVSQALIEFDVASIELTPGLKYIARIPDIGPITGVHDIQPNETGALHVFTRGRTTDHKSEGIVMALHTDGHTAGGTPPTFFRHYTNGIVINGTNGLFSDLGDSGSAVVVIRNDPNTPGVELHEVAAILFSGDGVNASFATAIADVLGNLHLTLETAISDTDEKTVPGTALFAAPVHLERRIDDAERRILAIPEGPDVVEAIRRHSPEAQTLVSKNRRVAAVWTRNDGIEFIQAVLGQPPVKPQTRTPEERLLKIQAIFERYASAEFVADLRRLGPRMMALLLETWAKFDQTKPVAVPAS